MSELGIPVHFTGLIITCLSTTKYYLIINEVPSPLIHPNRGLRMGDPLPPLDFIICMEYFSRSMKLVVKHPNFHFHTRCITIGINQLWFGDDFLLLCRGDATFVQLMLEGFGILSKATSLQVNH